jgi:hypothetical protein
MSTRKCGKCKQPGHNIRTCTGVQLNTVETVENIKKRPEILETRDTPYTLNTCGPQTRETETRETETRETQEYDDVPECGICLEPLYCDYVNSTPCEHIYHQLCLWSWLMIKPECPTCRTIVGINELITIDTTYLRF